MYRQGDILLKRVGGLPSKVERSDSNIVAYGEVTGHSHRLEGGATIYEAGAQMFVVSERGVSLVHDEHATIELPEGVYQVIRQREYDEGEIRYVTD